MKQKLLALIVAIFLFLGIVRANAALAWIASLRAEGEYIEGLYWYIVRVGVDTEAQVYPAPPAAFYYSVKMDLYSSDLSKLFSEDIRKEGDLIYAWVIGINPSGNAEPSIERTATISWNPSEFGPGGYKLQQGSDGTGPIVIADMKTTTSYNVTGPASTQFFTLIFTVDQCPDDPYKTEPGICGCGVADIDADQDGVLACNDCNDNNITAYPGATEMCDGVDNDCDDQVDEGLERPCSTACGTGTETCDNGQWVNCTAPAVEEEVCDGRDNDCDGSTDEGLGQTTCGVGECRVTVQNCVGGVPQTCIPGTPSSEVCDGRDNDCDGSTDEGLGQTTCGVGECRVTVQNCVGGVPQTCIPGTPSSEVCDGRDNDCDNQVDENLLRDCNSLCGTGTETCVNGQWVNCTAPLPPCEGDISVEMNLLKGWNMISLPVIPTKALVPDLFPGIVVAYGFDESLGYYRMKEDMEMEKGFGYWMLLNEDQRFVITGQPFQSYTYSRYEDGWELIGGCTADAEAITDNCVIIVIYKFEKALGYKRISESESLLPGQAYWILFQEVAGQCDLTVEITD